MINTRVAIQLSVLLLVSSTGVVRADLGDSWIDLKTGASVGAARIAAERNQQAGFSAWTPRDVDASNKKNEAKKPAPQQAIPWFLNVFRCKQQEPAKKVVNLQNADYGSSFVRSAKSASNSATIHADGSRTEKIRANVWVQFMRLFGRTK